MTYHIPQNVDVAHARLPQAYEAAKTALANCATVDECKDWADKAAALASYAKQANDETLMRQAARIRDRAIRRMGEVLKQFDGKGRNQYSEDTEGDHGKLSQRGAADQAGISEHQQLQAVRVANVPADEFEHLVESDKPPTISQLATMGIKPRPLIDLKGRDPGEFNRSLHFVAEFEDYAQTLRKFDLAQLLPGLIPAEAERVRKAIAEIDAIHDRIVTRI